ncbi:unnamed protein product, partial [marine sediment metagenome]
PKYIIEEYKVLIEEQQALLVAAHRWVSFFIITSVAILGGAVTILLEFDNPKAQIILQLLFLLAPLSLIIFLLLYIRKIQELTAIREYIITEIESKLPELRYFSSQDTGETTFISVSAYFIQFFIASIFFGYIIWVGPRAYYIFDSIIGVLVETGIVEKNQYVVTLITAIYLIFCLALDGITFWGLISNYKAYTARDRS